MKDCSKFDDLVEVEPLNRNKWFLPISENVNAAIDEILRMLHECKGFLNEPSPDCKHITIIDLPHREPVKLPIESECKKRQDHL
jgi:hypothetical protein